MTVLYHRMSRIRQTLFAARQLVPVDEPLFLALSEAIDTIDDELVLEQRAIQWIRDLAAEGAFCGEPR